MPGQTAYGSLAKRVIVKFSFTLEPMNLGNCNCALRLVVVRCGHSQRATPPASAPFGHARPSSLLSGYLAYSCSYGLRHGAEGHTSFNPRSALQLRVDRKFPIDHS
jgi:hypothetical protein